MSIVYSSSTGTIVLSYAMDETLATQAQQSNDNTVVVSDDIGTAGNGEIGTKYATYVGRKVIIELGETDEQERMVISQAAGTGTTIILTVHEDWDVNPVLGDTIHVMYNIDDIETGGEGGGIGLSSKTGLYELSNVLTLGDGTNPAGILLHDGTALECDDRGTNISFLIKAQARFDVGYLASGQPVNGGIVTAYNNTYDERWMYWSANSKGHVCDCLFWSQLHPIDFINLADCSVVFRKVKILFGTTGMEWLDSEYYDCSIQGDLSYGNQLLRLNAGSVVERLVVVALGYLSTEVGNTTVETVTVRDVVFIDMTRYVYVANNKTWNFINPSWDVDESSQLSLWFQSAAGTVNERWSIDATVQEADGTAIANALVIIYENTTTDLVLELVSDSNGLASDSWVHKKFVYLTSTTLTVTTYSGHALRVDKWLSSPFVAAQVSNEKFDGAITLIADPNISETTQATAKSDGSGITWNEDTNPSSIIAFTGGSGTLSVGNTVTGGTSGADGVVTKIVAGNSTAGTAHLKTRDAVDFSGTEGLSNGAGWTATLTSGSQKDFSIWIDGLSKSMQTVYDYLAALTSETTLTTNGELIHEWGRDSQGRALYLGTDGFYTERSYSKGVFITNYGVGTIEKFTDDAGASWVPPTSIIHKLTGMAENSEVTYTKKPTPYDSLTGLAFYNGSRVAEDIIANWTDDEFKGKLLVVSTAGVNEGRYYVVSNDQTKITLSEKAKSNQIVACDIYGTFTEVDHTENVPSNGENSYPYTYTGDTYADVIVFHVNYEDIVLTDVLLGNVDQTIPLVQIPDVNYFNPT